MASFPAPNVTVKLSGNKFGADQFDELFELEADAKPHTVDFLGNGIDGGFRIAQFAASDRCALSVELAWLLAQAAERNQFNGRFTYHSRHILKGVIRNRPYPIVSIDTERNHSRRMVRTKERHLNGYAECNATSLREFLEFFMDDEKMDRPIFSAIGLEDVHIPEVYREYRTAWQADVAEMAKREETEAEAETMSSDDAAPDLPAEVLTKTNQALEVASDKNTTNCAESE